MEENSWGGGGLLSWQDVGGGVWLRHPVASPPVPQNATTGLPERKTRPRNTQCLRSLCRNIRQGLFHFDILAVFICAFIWKTGNNMRAAFDPALLKNAISCM